MSNKIAKMFAIKVQVWLPSVFWSFFCTTLRFLIQPQTSRIEMHRHQEGKCAFRACKKSLSIVDSFEVMLCHRLW
jgi:hypothetical protein